jgi:transcriptional regulator with XRE-family HTH domain
MTPAQCIAGRIAAGLGARALAKLSGLMASAVGRFEKSGELPLPSQNKLQVALEAAGVEFIAEIGAGQGCD